MTTQAATAQPTAIGKGMMIGGVIAAAIGVIVMVIGHHYKVAAALRDFTDSLYVGHPMTNLTATATTIGHIGLGLLALGILLGICGLMVVALKATPTSTT